MILLLHMLHHGTLHVLQSKSSSSAHRTGLEAQHAVLQQGVQL
jgi:hypothetical protein